MEKKILYCASTASHLKNFHLPYMQKLQQMGYHITACVNKHCALPYADEIAVIPFHKKITDIENVKNIFRVYRLLKEEQFTAISVHTTLAAAIVRAAVLMLPAKQRPRVFYTCHGYLFGDQDGIGKWKYLLPEKICAGVTDLLMVMNQEDKQIAERHKLYKKYTGKQISIPGMGVDFTRFDIVQHKADLRKQYGVHDADILYVFAGEFSERKNQTMLIHAFARAAKQMPQAKLILAGEGALLEQCKQLVQQYNLQHQIIFAGYVTNMPALYHISDVCVSAGKIEGLPFNIMEAMHCQLPCIVSRIKGHTDLMVHGQTGYLFDDELQLANQMLQLYRDEALRQQMGAQAQQAVAPYALECVMPTIVQVYEENL